MQDEARGENQAVAALLLHARQAGEDAGDKIAVRDRAKEQLRIKAALTVAAQVGFPEWVEVDGENMQGLLKNLPERDEILPDINENLVVELYSK